MSRLASISMRNIFFVLATAPVFCANPSFAESSLQGDEPDFKSQTYQLKSAEDKRSALWEETFKSRWEHLPPLNGMGWSSLLTNLQAALSLKPTMDYSSDVLPKDRVKFIHAYGVTGLVKWVPDQTIKAPFTGVFQEETLGLIRLSVAADPAGTSFTPGLALKLLISGRPSLNLVAMPSLDGQGQDQNFFAKSFTTHIAPPKAALLRVLFWWFSLIEKEPAKLPVDQLAWFTPSGTQVLRPVAPSMLEFVPSLSLGERYQVNPNQDYREPLVQMTPGPLFTVYVKEDLNGKRLLKLGEIILEAPMVASEFADKKLFFQHMRKSATLKR